MIDDDLAPGGSAEERAGHAERSERAERARLRALGFTTPLLRQAEAGVDVGVPIEWADLEGRGPSRAASGGAFSVVRNAESSAAVRQLRLLVRRLDVLLRLAARRARRHTLPRAMRGGARGVRGAAGARSAAADTLHGGDVTVDLATRTVLRAGREVETTRREFALLCALLRRRGLVATRSELLAEVWGPGTRAGLRVVDTCVARLRRKLEPDPAHPRYIVTALALGYRFAPQAPPSPTEDRAARFPDGLPLPPA